MPSIAHKLEEKYLLHAPPFTSSTDLKLAL